MNLRRASRRIVLSLGALVLGIVVLSGCKKKVEAEKNPTSTTTAAAFQVGDKVDIQWNGSFWKGEVLERKGDKFRVHYTGWSASWDEDVTADRLRAPTDASKVGTEAPLVAAAAATAPAASSVTTTAASAAPVAAVAGFKVGDKVDINWKGQFWQGRIIGVTGGLFRVHYLGWASSWDESVTASRLRAPVAGTKRGTGAD